MNNRQSLQKSSLVNPSLSHYIDMLSLLIVYVGFFSCLIRTDYNLVIALFCYFLWQTSKDTITLRLMMTALALSALFDLIFIFTQLQLWMQNIPTNPIWQQLRPMHVFGIVCFCVINILKIILMLIIGKSISQKNKAVQTR